MTTTADELREEVRRTLRRVRARGDRGRSGGLRVRQRLVLRRRRSRDASLFGEALYDAEQRGELPEAAALASFGCGNPTALAELTRARPCSTLGPALAWMYCFRRNVSVRGA